MSRLLGILYHLCRVALGGVFLAAATVKIRDVSAFAGDIAAYRILPYAWNYFAAATLPYIEGLAGVLLLVNRRVRPAALVLLGLLLLFLAVLASVLARGLEIDCGCFGSVGGASPLAALGRDGGLLVLALLTYCLRGRLQPQSTSSSDAP